MKKKSERKSRHFENGKGGGGIWQNPRIRKKRFGQFQKKILRVTYTN